MDLLEVYQKSVRVITFLKEHPGGGVVGHGVSLNEIAQALSSLFSIWESS